MREGSIDYVWSSVLDFEIKKSRFVDRTARILPWKHGASADVKVDEGIRLRARDFEAAGVKPIDALHVACAEAAACDWFFTTDKDLLKKAHGLSPMRIANPIDFIQGA